MCVSLRQDLIVKLSKVGQDREAWVKAADHLAGLLNEDQMLTLENTDVVIKKFERHMQRVTIENKTDLVTITTTTTTDNLEIITLKTKVVQLESKVAFNAGPAVKRKRHDNNKKTGPQVIVTCTVCQKTVHKLEGCWFDAENKIRDAEVAKIKAGTQLAKVKIGILVDKDDLINYQLLII